MKKILILVMVLVAGSTTTFALNPIDYEVFYKMNNISTFNKLMHYLNTDNEQSDDLKYVFNVTEKEMKVALKNENEVDADKALNFNLANAKNILSTSQYKKYLTIINLTVNNVNNEVLLSEK